MAPRMLNENCIRFFRNVEDVIFIIWAMRARNIVINASGIHVHSQHMAEISYKRQSVAIVIYYFIFDAH